MTSGAPGSPDRPGAGPDLELARLAARQSRSQRRFYRSLGRSRGCHLIEGAGVEALSAPAAVRSSVFNTVFSYASADVLEEALPDLAAEFERLGVAAWSVLVPEHDDAAAALLSASGFWVASRTARMAGYIDPLNVEPGGELELIAQPTWSMVASCNDRAYGVAPVDGLESLVAVIDDPAFHLYVAAERGQPVCSVVSREEDGDCYLWFVATSPELRRRGIAIELTRRCLRDAADRGCETASGESTPIAVGLYIAVGGRMLGAQHMWVRQPGR